jgi:hypothetical protein
MGLADRQRYVEQNGPMRVLPTTKYAKAADGSQNASQVVGEGSIDPVFLTGSVSHVDVRLELKGVSGRWRLFAVAR